MPGNTNLFAFYLSNSNALLVKSKLLWMFCHSWWYWYFYHCVSNLVE